MLNLTSVNPSSLIHEATCEKAQEEKRVKMEVSDKGIVGN
jgi:hypothetical protein